jgi:hypothetical protein
MRLVPVVMSSLCGPQLAVWAAGPTLVSGNVSGTWTPDGNPYVLVDHCTVPSASTLTLEPGTVVILGEDLNLTVEGNLLARGTAAQRILFRAPNTNTYWGKIQVNWSPRKSDLQYCDFQRANTALVFDIEGARAGQETLQVAVTGCTFEDCAATAVRGWARGYGAAVGSGYASVRLAISMQGCRIANVPDGVWLKTEGQRSYFGGYYGVGSASLSITGTTFREVDTAVRTQEGEYPGTSDGQLHNNVFANCQTAVEVTPTFDLSLRNNVFADCNVGVKRTGTTSGQVGFNCFYNSATPFLGYPSTYGTLALQNSRGSPCDVASNIFENPRFAEGVSFLLAPDSPCVDAGDPAAPFNDVRFPPSRGAAVNDIGAYGGPHVLADDADMDGLLDAWELQHFGSLETTDGPSDPDADGLNNLREAILGTNPNNPDTDGDGYDDLAETQSGTNPLDPNSTPTFSLRIQVAAVDLELTTAAGHRYQFRASEGLGLWEDLFEPIVGDGSVVRRRVEVEGTRYRYFKVQDITSP